MSPRKSLNAYPPNWSEIAQQVKDAAGWRCVRCLHPHDRDSGHVLTVHHLDMNPANNAWWNLLPLCQRCHLQVQAKVVLERMWMLDHSLWFRPYVAGYYAARMGLQLDRQTVTEFADLIIGAAQAGRTLSMEEIQIAI